MGRVDWNFWVKGDSMPVEPVFRVQDRVEERVVLCVEDQVEERVEDRVVDEGAPLCVFFLVQGCESGIEGGLSTRRCLPRLTSSPSKVPA